MVVPDRWRYYPIGVNWAFFLSKDELASRRGPDLSRRNLRTQPGVLTPGYSPTEPPPSQGAAGTLLLRKGATPYLVNPNLHLPPFQGGGFVGRYPGLKPRAESFNPFEIGPDGRQEH